LRNCDLESSAEGAEAVMKSPGVPEETFLAFGNHKGRRVATDYGNGQGTRSLVFLPKNRKIINFAQNARVTLVMYVTATP
jgi:hypothetical protein